MQLKRLFMIVAYGSTLAGSARAGAEQSPRVENLGALMEASTLIDRFLIRVGEAEWRFLACYYGAGPFQILDVDLRTGESSLIDALGTRPGPNATVFHTNGKLYIASASPGYLLEYDPAARKQRLVGRLAEGAQYAVEGDDGAIYIGETTKGFVERFDPGTGTLENFGIMDDPGPPYYRYAYSLGADDRYVYVGMGQNPWYLVVFDRQTRTQKTFWKDLQVTNLIVEQGRDGGWFGHLNYREGTVVRVAWYRLENGQPANTPLGAPPALALYRGNVVESLAEVKRISGYEIDLDKAIPDTGTEGLATIRWKTAGEGDWREASQSVRMVSYVLKSVHDNGDGRLLVISATYGPEFLYDPTTGTTAILGRTGYDLIDAVKHGYIWYFAGYPAATFRYDTNTEWNLTPTTPNAASADVNPRKLGGVAKYHCYLAIGVDGCIYVGVHHERDSVGGELAWYNSEGQLIGRLREPFEKQDVRGLIAVEGGKRIVYSSSGIEEKLDGRLFVFNVAEKKIEREIVPLPGVRYLDKIVEVEPGVVVGIAGTRYFKVNIRDGLVLWNRDLGGNAFPNIRSWDYRLVVGPDGYVWLYIDNTIARVRPADGTIEHIVDAAPAGGLRFCQGDLYIYGGTSLRRIRGLLAE